MKLGRAPATASNRIFSFGFARKREFMGLLCASLSEWRRVLNGLDRFGHQADVATRLTGSSRGYSGGPGTFFSTVGPASVIVVGRPRPQVRLGSSESNGSPDLPIFPEFPRDSSGIDQSMDCGEPMNGRQFPYGLRSIHFWHSFPQSGETLAFVRLLCHVRATDQVIEAARPSSRLAAKGRLWRKKPKRSSRMERGRAVLVASGRPAAFMVQPMNGYDD